MGWKRRNRLLYALVAAAMTVMLLAACGGNNDKAGDAGATEPAGTGQAAPSQEQEAASPEAEPQEDEQTERTLVDPLGHEVVVPAKPQRVLGSYLEDYLVALGVEPVAQWSVGGSPMGYLQEELADVQTVPHDLPFEAVTSLAPDLILIGDEALIADGKYDTYAKIAPTYALGQEVNTDWRKALLKIGEVLGKGEEAQSVLDSYDEELRVAREKIDAAYEGKRPSATAIWLVSKTFWMVSDNQSSGDVLYRDLGLAVPELVERISKGEGGIWKSVSLEALTELDADHIFLINSDAATGSEALKDPIWQSVKAVKNGNVHEYPANSSWLYTGIIANRQIVEDVLESLAP
ncbi:ABC transporter substrate-binding protein [Cohnella sp. CIP 111063]|uniref:ABC transporter substrate-binding protein n=1 Tax=unclassified Cohnella TaxID=2636738 RepID=UPI000B8BD967|nr:MULTISPECIES: ABC transporter substrate-binding protein [unclassified Cohnella]OXS62714.1 ABC transporter substrate-binding protein [Cohnella sp. CIP 111063]PRX74982.1 iron complex transport system substrate-binding protein [Cohnella sp. SGD-V74]